jgi:hypothetical protein
MLRQKLRGFIAAFRLAESTTLQTAAFGKKHSEFSGKPPA